MGSLISKVSCWIINGVITIATAIWHAVKYLFTKIWDGFKWLASWIASWFFTEANPQPTGPSPTGPPPFTHTTLVSTTVQQKKAMVGQLGEAKDLMKDIHECFEIVEDIWKEDIATGNTQETERKLREIKQKAEMKNITGRLDALREVPAVLG